MDNREPMTAEEQERIYQNALLLIEGELYGEAADELARIPGYRDADERRIECEQRKATKHLDDIYEEADKAAANGNVRSQEKAIQLFSTIPGYRDADARIEQAKEAIQAIQRKERADRAAAIRAAEQRALRRKKRIRRIVGVAIGLVLVAAACFVGVFLYKKYAVPELQYRRGVEQMEAGARDEAYWTLHGMNYKDSSDLIFSVAKDRLQNAQVGSTVLFGAYPQGLITSQEKTPIEWLVLERDGSRMLLISKYALDALPFMRYDYDPMTVVSWQTSLLRNWLNREFLNIAFDDGEIRMLERTAINDILPDGSLGMKVMDRVFLLSVGEAKTYFPTDEDRKCIATLYALGYGAYHSSVDGTCLWWLRTPVENVVIMETTDESGYAGERAACVGTSGEIVEVGHAILLRGYAVRPAIWVDTEATGD